jgi:hypothetical protein
MNDTIKNILDLNIFIAVPLGIIAQIIPVIAGVFTIIWGYYRIKEIRLTNQIHEANLRKLLKD